MNLNNEIQTLIKKIDDNFARNPNSKSVSILEGELKNVESLLYTLKGKGVIGLFQSAFVETSNQENALQDLLYSFDINKEKFEEFKKKFREEIKSHLVVNFDKEASVLSVGGKKIKIKLRNDKPVDHYILEYLFENEEGLKAKSYYADILNNKFPLEDKSERTLRRACEAINRKVSNQAGVSNFLKFESGKTGSVQINPDYL